MIKYKCHKEVLNMARKEKMSEERKRLIQEFIKSNDFKSTVDIQEAIKDLFKDTIQEMLNAELTEHYEIKNRGVKDILIMMCADGLKGLKEAISTVISNDKISTLYSAYDKKYIAVCII